MYEAIICVNDSSRRPIKLELFFCPELAKQLNWRHAQQVIFRFRGTPERWLGTIGLKTPHFPYVWANVTLVNTDLKGGGRFRRPTSELLHQHKLGPGDRVPVHVDQCGDLVLDAKPHRAGHVSVSGPHNHERRARRSNSSSSHGGDSVKAFPFGNRKEIEELASIYWETISRSERHVEQHVIPQVVESARKRGYLLKDEFVTLARWKSTRPTRSYHSNTQNHVEGQTKRALLPTANREDSLEALVRLNGIKQRTATAILHWFRPDDTPILDVRVVAAAGLETPKGWENNIDYYRAFAEKIIREAQIAGVALRTIDRALWTWDKHTRLSNS